MTTESPARVNSFNLDGLEEFKPKDRPPVAPSQDDLDQIAEQTGFVSRQPKPAAAADSPMSHPASRQRRYKTGRNQQLNIKVTSEAMQRFYDLADKMDEPLGKVFELAVKALEDAKQT